MSDFDFDSVNNLMNHITSERRRLNGDVLKTMLPNNPPTEPLPDWIDEVDEIKVKGHETLTRDKIFITTESSILDVFDPMLFNRKSLPAQRTSEGGVVVLVLCHPETAAKFSGALEVLKGSGA